MKSDATHASGSISKAERVFMQKAAGGGMAEVEWGKLAQEHGSSAEVKRIGETLEKDHSEANQKLKALAAEKGVSLPASIPQKEKALMEKMKQRSGTEFDRQFLQHQLKHHKEDIRHFEHASQRSEDADLKAFTTGTLPVLEKHEEMIREAAQGMHLKVDGTSARSRLRGDAASSEASHRGDGHHVDQTDVEALKREQEKHVDQTDVESGSRRSTGERDR